MSTENKIPGIRRDGLRKCDHCGQGLMHQNQICAYRVEVTQYIASIQNINASAGLEMVLGGNAALAHIMGTNPEFFEGVSKSNALLCQNCFMDVHAAEAWEDGGKHGTGATS